MDATDVQPVAVDHLDEFDYPTRAQALRLARSALTGPDHWFASDLADVMCHPNFRDIVAALAAMANAAFCEYYGQWDYESADAAMLREITLAEDLAKPQDSTS